MLRIWTDGACFPNPGKGGWAWISEDGRSGSGFDESTTNQRMELLAAIKALEECFDGNPITIYSDSQYLVLGATDWIWSWARNGWNTQKGFSVKNQDLWMQIFDACAGPIFFKWVRGHSGDEMNEKADALAQSATGLPSAEIKKYLKQYHGDSACQ